MVYFLILKKDKNSHFDTKHTSDYFPGAKKTISQAPKNYFLMQVKVCFNFLENNAYKVFIGPKLHEKISTCMNCGNVQEISVLSVRDPTGLSRTLQNPVISWKYV